MRVSTVIWDDQNNRGRHIRAIGSIQGVAAWVIMIDRSGSLEVIRGLGIGWTWLTHFKKCFWITRSNSWIWQKTNHKYLIILYGTSEFWQRTYKAVSQWQTNRFFLFTFHEIYISILNFLDRCILSQHVQLILPLAPGLWAVSGVYSGKYTGSPGWSVQGNAVVNIDMPLPIKYINKNNYTNRVFI